VIRDLKNLEHGTLDPAHGLEPLLSRDRPGIEAIPANGGFIKSGIINRTEGDERDGEKANSKFQILTIQSLWPLGYFIPPYSALYTLSSALMLLL